MGSHRWRQTGDKSVMKMETSLEWQGLNIYLEVSLDQFALVDFTLWFCC